MRSRGAVVLAACLALALAALVARAVFGGSSGARSKAPNVADAGDEEQSAFAVQAAAICAQSVRRRGRLVAPTGPRQIARVAAALVPMYDYRLRRLRALAPLTRRPKIYRAWLTQIRKARSHLIAAGSAGRRGDRKNADFELRLFAGAQSTAEFLAEQLHVEGCAEQE